VKLYNSFRYSESIINEVILELQCVGRKRVKGLGVRSMAKLKIKIDGHCPAYMLAAKPCGQTSLSPFQELSPEVQKEKDT
jgi:hypothetical protein